MRKDNNTDSERVLFMAVENDEVKGEVYLERELVSALKDLKLERNKFKALEKELSEVKEHSKNFNKKSEELENTIINVKFDSEKTKIIK